MDFIDAHKLNFNVAFYLVLIQLQIDHSIPVDDKTFLLKSGDCRMNRVMSRVPCGAPLRLSTLPNKQFLSLFCQLVNNPDSCWGIHLYSSLGA